MERVLIIGGTRFIGRHLVEEFRSAGYGVAIFNRGRHDNPFEGHERVTQFTGDRKSGAAIAEAADQFEPDAVVDCVAYFPGEVRMATRWLDTVDTYVFVSSGDAYGVEEIPKREDETPLEPCSDEQAVDDSPETYGARKAEGDRAVFAAAEEGVRAMSVRPTIVYGPHDYTGRFEYWVERVRNQDRILLPGDGTNIHHLVAVENVARAVRTVVEEGAAGEAYNVGDRTVLTLDDVVGTIADVLGRDVELVTAGARELSAGGLEPTDFPLYNPDVHLLSTGKLAALGWDPVPPAEAFENAIAGPVDPERDPGPDRTAEQRVLDSLDS